MEVIYYTLVAAGLYLASDRLLNYIETSRGERFKYRSIIFFVIILIMAFLAFGFVNFIALSSQ
ncbi:MAG: hypothetical protein Q7U78_03315 [Gallionella sp.]|nr:hypothetical protein [Gallionella sp.]